MNNGARVMRDDSGYDVRPSAPTGAGHLALHNDADSFLARGDRMGNADPYTTDRCESCRPTINAGDDESGKGDDARRDFPQALLSDKSPRGASPGIAEIAGCGAESDPAPISENPKDFIE